MRRVFLSTGAAILAVCGLAGCSNQPVVGPEIRTTTESSGATREDELHNAMRYVQFMNDYDYDKASEKALGSLGAWISAAHDDREFKIDPLRDRLPKEIKPFFPAEGLAGEKFRSDDYAPLRQYLRAPATLTPIANGVRSSDFRYLHETHLFKRIADWAVKQQTDAEMEGWLDEQAKKLDERSARKLRDAARLFDWTIRHMQIEAAPPEPARTSSGPSASGGAEQASLPPTLQGKPGPGYTQFPGHAVLLGRGDFVQRAWVFCLLARQVGCDVVMLAIENPQTSRPEPWAAGAVIGDQIYLFDTLLGLPIPLENDRGIATFAQVKENDGLLRRLDLSAEMVYPANAESLQRVAALVEFCDASISKRMSLLESRLTGDEQMILFVHPSEIAESVRKGGVSQVYPWRIAYDAILFRAAIDARLRSDFQFFMQYYTFETPFMRPSPLAAARYEHLGGDLAGSDEEEPGAIDRYMASRTSNDEIQRYEQSEEGKNLFKQKMMGERELTDADKQQLIAAQKNAMMQSKVHASFFMGVAQYDRGAYPVAEEWLRKRTLEATPDGPWTIGAKYNLARALEMQKRYREAREIYLADQSPQKQGNLIRARRLKPLADAEPVKEEAEKQR